MSIELPSQYNHKETEDKIYDIWQKSGYFNPDKLPKTNNLKSKTFSIVVPPPNITGSLHMGHALNAVIQDILIRKKRMEGFKTLWLPGTDHAGIATQNVVEKQLKKEGITRQDLGREKFIEKIWEWKEKYGSIILEQFKKIGSSMDWSRARFTMDQEYQKAVKTAFDHYYKKGWIYQAERVINWCSRCRTSLSDLELEYQETQTILYYIKYPLVKNPEKPKTYNLKPTNHIVVATTRPETMLGDSAVAVSPKDKRYQTLIGKKVLLPIQNREIPIIADPKIEIEFGTGAVKVTPAHDMLDSEIGERHKLIFHKIIDEKARMTEKAGKICEGLKTFECRDRIIIELKKLGLIEKEESIRHNIAVCYRCGTIIQPIPSLQWFLKMGELAEQAIKSVKNGKVKFYPKRWEKIYFDWLKNVKDWCISRQIWWGHKIPLKESDDVLDTWFSSGLWPFAALGWPKKTKDLKLFYPTNVLSTARDIINLWVSRMIFSGLEFQKKEPFRDVFIHATILTKDGKRMSKSLGTGIDPMDLIERYGADATRFGLIWQAMGNQDIHWSEEHVVAGKKFTNKIWNASRFVLMQLPASGFRLGAKPKPITKNDRNILFAFERTKREADKKIEKYEFGQALHIIYDFFWHYFCDKYLEISKTQIVNNKTQDSTKQILLYVLANSLKILHPFMPFITEDIWDKLPIKNKRLLMVEQWPKNK